MSQNSRDPGTSSAQNLSGEKEKKSYFPYFSCCFLIILGLLLFPVSIFSWVQSTQNNNNDQSDLTSITNYTGNECVSILSTITSVNLAESIYHMDIDIRPLPPCMNSTGYLTKDIIVRFEDLDIVMNTDMKSTFWDGHEDLDTGDFLQYPFDVFTDRNLVFVVDNNDKTVPFQFGTIVTMQETVVDAFIEYSHTNISGRTDQLYVYNRIVKMKRPTSIIVFCVVVQVAMFIIVCFYILIVLITNSHLKMEGQLNNPGDLENAHADKGKNAETSEHTYEEIRERRARKLEIDTIAVAALGATILFALPSVRGIQPGVPEFGCVADIFYTWDIVVLSGGLVLLFLAFMYYKTREVWVTWSDSFRSVWFSHIM